ncbi:NAD(P)-dependent dehydrogenase (short-subunit alcohol dehydrogenase family) [Actinoplanes tereljensis]|uniref:3-oxoacyl-ACP reductase n=1 Tax=Paractinoplanes tereljensis TaxID=571912 RepID=A0A919NRC7_9ACTN|nr:SDR family oxidoreductase [Actinoplanes tereljensis]GIF22197.1 3-oxoacyl-ACP reductase [Actinoplanes tereljensis]
MQGKTAIVTGASKGIGLAIVRALAGAGATVIAAARTTTPELDTLVKAGGVRWVRSDLGDPAAPAELVEAAGGAVDVLVNNVGTAPARLGGFLSVTDAEWQRTIDLNLLTAVRMSRAVLPSMVERGHGSIVTVASVNASLSDPLVVDYSAGKAALVSFSKSLSKEFGPKGVRANTVSPGPVETDLWLGGGGVAATVSAGAGLRPEDVVAQAKAGIPSGRFSTPDEVAAVVLFLAGDVSGNVNGSDFVIDGGLRPMW